MEKRCTHLHIGYPRSGADPGFFLRGGALVSCSTSTPINHIVFFCRIPVVLENRRSSQGESAHPLHPPPRSAPDDVITHTLPCSSSKQTQVLPWSSIDFLVLHDRSYDIVAQKLVDLSAKYKRQVWTCPKSKKSGRGAHNPEQVAITLGLCLDVFTDQFIFRYILVHFFPRKWKLYSFYERIWNKTHQNWKLNVIKRSKIPFLGL